MTLLFSLLLAQGTPGAPPSAGRGAQPITPDVSANAQSPRWSPDGASLSYELNFHEKKLVQTWVYRPGQEPIQVQPRASSGSSMTAGFQTSGAEQVVHELDWSPASLGAVVYSASGADRDYELYLAQADTLLGGSPIAPSPGADGGARFSPDGNWIAFSSARSGQGDIYLLSVAHLEQPPKRISTDTQASELYLSWSGDGKRLAWVGHSPKGDSIYVVDDLLRPKPRVLVQLGQTQTRPSFSPDGQSMAFYSNHQQPERFDLLVQGPSGAPRVLAEGVVLNHDGPSWSPDGQHIVFVADDDAAFDPVLSVSSLGGEPVLVDTRTVGNSDLDLTQGTDGQLYLALSAQGRRSDPVRDYKRLYVMALDL
ncbi:MAG: Tol biopolymer transport system component [Cognaticolwellia sp.]|jgi:Tol biopolymer transport system component